MRARVLACAVACAFALVACARADEAKVAAADPSVHTLALPEPPFELPEAPGRALVSATCMTCHSARYIANQPRFPRKTWAAEVDKMKKTYGAQVPEEKTSEIIDYLVATRGMGD